MKNLKLEIIQANDKYQILKINTYGNGVLDVKDLTNINLPENTDESKGVVIYGRAPIWLYTYLVHECHSFAWVAVYDPRLGGIVVQSHIANSFSVGDIIPFDEIKEFIKNAGGTPKPPIPPPAKHKAIAIVGPPHSGKSVFLQNIKNILTENPKYQDDFFIFRACPDGEGNWSGEIPDDIRNLIREKKVFDDEFPDITGKQIMELRNSKKLVLVDCGGIIDKKNQTIMNACNSAIIISSKPDDIPEWVGACKTSELDVLAIINSVWEEKSELIANNPLTFTIGKFDRNFANNVVIPNELKNILIGYLQ